MSQNLTNDEKEIWIKGIQNKQNPFYGALCIQTWFDYKNNPINVIDEKFKKLMIETIEKNNHRIYQAQLKLLAKTN